MEQKIVEIPLDKIMPNKSQPREEFDKEKVQELAESILSNGLINPIKVRKNGNGTYIIVAGERRWKACKIAGFKTIQAIAKEYKDDGEWMLESFIENVQREDLNPLERAKYLKKIMDVKKFTTAKELAEFTKISPSTIADAFDVLNFKEDVKRLKLSQTQVVETRGLSDADRKKVMEKASKEDIGNRTLREVVKVVKAAPEDVKRAFFKNEIDAKQAEKLSKFESPKARIQAIKETKRFKKLSNLPSKNNSNSKPEISDLAKKQFSSAQRKIFKYLNDSKASLGKADNCLKQANMLLVGLLSKSFEYGLPKKTLILTAEQLKSITNRINEFDITQHRFNELKITFAERMEGVINEEK